MSDTVTPSTIVIVAPVGGQSPEDVADALGIPVIAEIQPRPDPVYGHVFTWPAQEVAQIVAGSALPD